MDWIIGLTHVYLSFTHLYTMVIHVLIRLPQVASRKSISQGIFPSSEVMIQSFPFPSSVLDYYITVDSTVTVLKTSVSGTATENDVSLFYPDGRYSRKYNTLFLFTKWGHTMIRVSVLTSVLTIFLPLCRFGPISDPWLLLHHKMQFDETLIGSFLHISINQFGVLHSKNLTFPNMNILTWSTHLLLLLLHPPLNGPFL